MTVTAFWRKASSQHLLPKSVPCPPAHGDRAWGQPVPRGTAGGVSPLMPDSIFLAYQLTMFFISGLTVWSFSFFKPFFSEVPNPTVLMHSAPSMSLPEVDHHWMPCGRANLQLSAGCYFYMRLWLASRLCVGAAGVIWALAALVPERLMTELPQSPLVPLPAPRTLEHMVGLPVSPSW